MRGTVLYGPRDVRFEDREAPRIQKPTDAILRMAVTCVCGSDLWPYRGIQKVAQPTPMGHEYCGFVEEVGSAVKTVKPGQFVIGSFCISDNTCPNCQDGYQSGCQNLEFMSTAQAPVRVFHGPMALSCRQRSFRRTICSPACSPSPMFWERAGSLPMRPM